MAKKVEKTVPVEENVNNLPDLVIEVPNNPDIDISAWCADIKRALGKQYNIIFVFPEA